MASPFSQQAHSAAQSIPGRSLAHVPPHENPDLDIYRTFSPSDVGMWNLFREPKPTAAIPPTGPSQPPPPPGPSGPPPGTSLTSRNSSGFLGRFFSNFGKTSA